MSKLTLSIDRDIIARAKMYAEREGISVSEMVEAYLAAVSGSAPRVNVSDAPVLRMLRGSLKRANPEAYHKHLAAKYR